MLRQIINGSVKKTIMVSGSQTDLEALSNFIAGKIEIWDKKHEGGNTTAVPTPLNVVKFSVGKVNIDGSRHSFPINVPHMKKSKSFAELKTSVIGVWDADDKTTTKCDYCNGIGNSSRG